MASEPYTSRCPEPGCVVMIAVDAQASSHTVAIRQAGEDGRLVHTVFGHVPVSGPFATGDREQPALIDVNRVVA